jgi:uridine monophosphate synthetase
MAEGESDALGQTYLTPAEVIGRRRSDVIIVGRGILQAPDPAQAAQTFREAGYRAYQDNVGDQGAEEAGASAGGSDRGDN